MLRRCPYFALGLPLYRMSSWSIRSCHSRVMLALMSLMPPPFAMIVGRFDVSSHVLNIRECRFSVWALSASLSCLCFIYRSSGGMPSSVSMARVGVLISSLKAFLMAPCRTLAASFMWVFFDQTSIPYVSCGIMIPLISLWVHQAFSPPIWYRDVRAPMALPVLAALFVHVLMWWAQFQFSVMKYPNHLSSSFYGIKAPSTMGAR